MKIASISVALLATLSVAIWTSHASARQSAGWPAAAAKCRVQVRAQYLREQPLARLPSLLGGSWLPSLVACRRHDRRT
jgi:hypothetical protein